MDLEEEGEIAIIIIADVEGELDFKGTKIKTLAVTNFCVKSYEMTGHLNMQPFLLHGKYTGGSCCLQSTQSYKGQCICLCIYICIHTRRKKRKLIRNSEA